LRIIPVNWLADPTGVLVHKASGRNAQVDVVGHRMPFHQLNSSRSASIPQDRADLPAQPSGEYFPAVFLSNHDSLVQFQGRTSGLAADAWILRRG
jgi:hypothetical protein